MSVIHVVGLGGTIVVVVVEGWCWCFMPLLVIGIVWSVSLLIVVSCIVGVIVRSSRWWVSVGWNSDLVRSYISFGRWTRVLGWDCRSGFRWVG